MFEPGLGGWGAGEGIALKLACYLKLALQGKSCHVGNGAGVMGTEPPKASKQEVWGSWVWLGLGGSTAGGQGAPWCGGERAVLLHLCRLLLGLELLLKQGAPGCPSSRMLFDLLVLQGDLQGDLVHMLTIPTWLCPAQTSLLSFNPRRGPRLYQVSPLGVQTHRGRVELEASLSSGRCPVGCGLEDPGGEAQRQWGR